MFDDDLNDVWELLSQAYHKLENVMKTDFPQDRIKNQLSFVKNRISDLQEKIVEIDQEIRE